MIERSEPGLAYVEKTAAGSYVVGNPSETAAIITVTLPALAGLKATYIDDNGTRPVQRRATRLAPPWDRLR